NAKPDGNCQLGTTTQATGGRAVLVENNGTIDANITAQSTPFFTSLTALPDGNRFGCKASYGESGASIAQMWATTFLDCYNGSAPKIIGCLAYADAGDLARIDFNVHIPPDEPPGLKQGTITLTATAC
ncbi:MAG: hypothetical protein Q7R47_03970, partial [Candidatus Diapherotrites archaeon]|nr:hypothetical protein [Candidatus Diapherotrites archaeon]